MPDRILRAELLTSEAWLALKDNGDRACWIALFLSADTLGNQPAGPYRLVHLWRPYGIDSTEKAAQTLGHLSDVGLCITYPHGGKQYVNLPRFRQSPRFLGRLWPVPDWAEDWEKQAYAKKSRENRKRPRESLGESPEGVGVGVGVEVEDGVYKTGVGRVSSSTAIVRATTEPPPPPETHLDKIGITVQHLTQAPNRKTIADLEAERSRQLDFVAKHTKGG